MIFYGKEVECLCDMFVLCLCDIYFVEGVLIWSYGMGYECWGF